MMQKIGRRLKLFLASLPAMAGAAVFEFNRQPWQMAWDWLFAPVATQQQRSEHYMRKYFSYRPVEGIPEKHVVDFGPAKVVISEKFGKIPLQLADIINNYRDIIYSYTVRFRIPSVEGTEGIYERDGVVVKPDDIVIDAGANVGLFTFFAAGKAGDGGKVYAFEPIFEYAEIINDSKPFNNSGKTVEVVPFALSDAPSHIQITYPLDRKVFSNEADVVTLDDFVKTHNLPRVDFIKSDIEGYERNLLRGAAQTLAQFKPRLAICTYHLPDDVPVLTDIIMKANPAYKISYSSCKLFAW